MERIIKEILLLSESIINERIPKPLPQSQNWFMLICGRPGSGKTTLILNLVAKNGKNYNKKYSLV